MNRKLLLVKFSTSGSVGFVKLVMYVAIANLNQNQLNSRHHVDSTT